MSDNREKHLPELLEEGQRLIGEIAKDRVAERQWDKAKVLLDAARQIENVIRLVTGTVPSQTALDTPNGRKLPYHYVERDRLVWVGRSREGGTYKHNVVREHYDAIASRLCEIAKTHSEFETRDELVDKCAVPRHEPTIIVKVLGDLGLLRRIRRGRWGFTDAGAFPEAAAKAWDRLPRR